MIMHNFPLRDSIDVGPNRGRPHALASEHCWCDPTILIWGEKPNGRKGWVVLVN